MLEAIRHLSSYKILFTCDHVHMCFLNCHDDNMMSAFLCAGRNTCLASISVVCFGDQMLLKLPMTMEWYDDRGLLQVISIVVSCNTLLLMSYNINSWMQYF